MSSYKIDMLAFEKYLEKKGWECLDKDKSFSSMGMIFRVWSHPNQSISFGFGLGDKGYSPTLLFPCPLIVDRKEDHVNVGHVDQLQVNKIISKTGIEGYYNRVIDNNMMVNKELEWLV